MFDKKYIFEFKTSEAERWIKSLNFNKLEDFWNTVTIHIIKGHQVRVHKDSQELEFL